MAKSVEGGQIDYRKRVKDRAAAAAAASEAAWKTANVASPLEVVPTTQELPTVAPAPAPAPATTSAPTATAPKTEKTDKHAKTDKSAKSAKSKTRTQSEIRAEAAAMTEQLLSLTDEEYTAAMQKLSAEDAMLYTAVVDAINNADATADPDTV